MAILKKETDWLRHCVVVVAILLLASWMFFFWYRDQYMCEITEISVQQDSGETGGSNYFYGGGIDGETEHYYQDRALGQEGHK